MITIKLVGGAKKSFNSEQLQIEKSDLSVNELLEHLLKIKPSNTSELDIENLLIEVQLAGAEVKLSRNMPARRTE